tara:strand:+ start:1888 stop:2253 length:366 start_codon:yes stop_codon:yes gene_type:complete
MKYKPILDIFSRFSVVIFLLGFLVFYESFTNKGFTGVNKYTKLDKIDDWIIQRKINNIDQSLKCRAFLPRNGTWFGSNVRINNYGQLIVPDDIVYSESENSKVLAELRSALRKCKVNFVYF